MKARAAVVPALPVLGLLALELMVGAGLGVVFALMGWNVASLVVWLILIAAWVLTSTLLLSHVRIDERGFHVRLGMWSSAMIPAGHVMGADAVSARESFGAHVHGSDLVINGVWTGQRWPMLRVHCDAAYPARIGVWRRVHVTSVTVSVSPLDWEQIAAASRDLARSRKQNP